MIPFQEYYFNIYIECLMSKFVSYSQTLLHWTKAGLCSIHPHPPPIAGDNLHHNYNTNNGIVQINSTENGEPNLNLEEEINRTSYVK